jgi:predicted permease
MPRRLGFGARLRGLWWKPDPAREVNEEFAHHRELLIQEGVARGLGRDAAEAEARRQFGAEEQLRRECEQLAQARDRRLGIRELLADLRDDLHWTLRSLRRSPAYALAAGSTLALVVAANALVFTVVYAVLLRPLPYVAPDRLVALNERTLSNETWELSLPNLEELRAGSAGTATIGAWTTNEVTLSSEDTPRIQVAFITPEFFPVLGTPAALGRTLDAPDEQSVVLSHAAWQRWFGGDPAILSQAVTLNTQRFVVIGVMPPEFRFPDARTAAWLAFPAPAAWMRNRAVHIFQGIARLEPGVPRERGVQQLELALAQVQSAHPGEDTGHTLLVRGLRERLTGGSRPVLFLLLASVATVLLLACANLAGLTATRALQRESELSLRAALGASRGRLVRQLVVESVVLGLAGGAAGLLIAALALPRLLSLLPSDLPSPTAVVLDRTIALGTLGIALLAGLAIGLVAALRPRAPTRRATSMAPARRPLAASDSCSSVLWSRPGSLSLASSYRAPACSCAVSAKWSAWIGFRTGLALATLALPARASGPPASRGTRRCPNGSPGFPA